MKKSTIALSTILVAGTLGCTAQQEASQSNATNAKEQVMENETVKLKISATYKLQMGYGSIYDCKVENVLEGNMKEGALYQLVIIKEKYEEFLGEQKTCIATFKKIAENVEENRLTTDGFIDEHRNGWEVVSIE